MPRPVVEDLEEPVFRLIPRTRWLAPVFLLIVILVGLVVLFTSVWSWLRPVRLPPERLRDVFSPALAAGDQRWQEPGELERDRFLPRFCNGILVAPLADAAQVVSPRDRAHPVGNAFSAGYGTTAQAEAGFTTLAQGLDRCESRGSSWTRTRAHEVSGVQVASFRIVPKRPGPEVRHALLFQYANTMTLFFTVESTAPEPLAAAYSTRIRDLARAD